MGGPARIAKTEPTAGVENPQKKKGGGMAALYTEAANRKQLALDAMHALANKKGKIYPRT